MLTSGISYLSLVHGVAAGACLTLAMTHIVLVVRSEDLQQRWKFLASALMAISAGAAIVFELQKVLSADVEAFIAAFRGEVAAVFVMIVALLNFVRLYFRAPANAVFLIALFVWTAGTAYQLAYFPGGFFSEINGLVTIYAPWGESFVKLDATVTTQKYVSDVGSVLVLVYISLASVNAWRRGERQAASIVGGASIGFMLIAGILVPLDDEGMLRFTMPVGLPFLAIVGALTYQLIDDRIQANRFRLEIEQLRRVTLAGEITAGLVHELNQPLTSILSNSQAARRFLDAEPPDLEEVRAAIDDVVTEDKRAASIIHGLKNLLRRGPVETTIVDVNDTIRRVARMLAGDFATSDIKLRLSLAPSPLKVTAGQVQIEQVLLNLLLNSLRAVKQAASGARSVEVRSGVQNGSVDVSVVDTGPGVNAEISAQLFEPFTSGGDGLGMGLAICRRIVTLHGGTIKAENTDGGGARFSFTLPLNEPTTGT